MAYIALNPADITSGKPTKEELFTRLRDNQESFNTDIEALKQTSTIDIFDVRYSGSVAQYSQAELDVAAPTYKAPVGATMTSFVVTLLTVSTSGTLEIDLEKSTDNGINWSPLLNNPVSVTTSTVGSISSTVDWVDVPSQSFNQNDLLRVRVSGLQVDQGNFHVSIYGEVS